MPTTVIFVGGPCDAQQQSVAVQPKIGDTLTCGGHTYTLTQLPIPPQTKYEFVDQGTTGSPSPPPPPPPPPPSPSPPPPPPPPPTPVAGSANYTLIASQSSIQVISPTVVQDVVVITIQTQPHGVIADIWVTKDEWDKGTTGVTLSGFAANIEKIMASPQVVGATTGSVLDPNGLLQSEISFVVGYAPPGSPYPPATVDVDISANSLRPEDVMGQEPGVTAALGKINTAYQNLVVVATPGG